MHVQFGTHTHKGVQTWSEFHSIQSVFVLHEHIVLLNDCAVCCDILVSFIRSLCSFSLFFFMSIDVVFLCDHCHRSRMQAAYIVLCV